jgi:hypothetical protein
MSYFEKNKKDYVIARIRALSLVLSLFICTGQVAAFDGTVTGKIDFESLSGLDEKLSIISKRVVFNDTYFDNSEWALSDSTIVSSWAFISFPDVFLHIWKLNGRSFITITALGNEVSTFEIGNGKPNYSIKLYQKFTMGENYYFCDAKVGYATMVFELDTFASVSKIEQLSPCTALNGGGDDGTLVSPTVNDIIVRFSRYE